MDTTIARAAARLYDFTGVLEVVDCVNTGSAKTIYRKTGLRNPFTSIFPAKIFQETGFHFYSDMSGGTVIMEIHDVNLLKDYMDALADHRIFGIYWDEIYDQLKLNHQIN
ncbi:MAG: hypothetical protein JXB08_02475 [Bacilli bacterium]|nr:hypothetical protein [Bacilli bacterium]MBN2877638.1 hypothetical protein [Bacilli bacterium]